MTWHIQLLCHGLLQQPEFSYGNGWAEEVFFAIDHCNSLLVGNILPVNLAKNTQLTTVFTFAVVRSIDCLIA